MCRAAKFERSVYSSGSPALPVCVREEFQFHVSNRLALAFIRLGWLGDSAQLLFAWDGYRVRVGVRFIVTVKYKIIPKLKHELIQLRW